MADLSKVQVGSDTYDVKDAYARQHLINTASATAQTLAAGSQATAAVDISSPGTAEFEFGIPKGDPGIMNASFSGSALLLDVSGS